MTSKLLNIKNYGHKIWLDNLSRELLNSGKLAELIAEDGIAGVTSNPSIFHKAISSDMNYTADAATVKNSNLFLEARYESLVIPDIKRACELMLPLYNESNGEDGYISFEVSPYLANDANATVENARRLWHTINKPNLMIKIPATPAGNEALQILISEGINVNVTLIFSLNQLLNTWEAYVHGLSKRHAAARPLNHIKAVASFFLSRIDSAVDSKLPDHLKGKTAINLAKTAYLFYQDIFKNDICSALTAAGAKTQLLLWASTGTKNPAYSDVLYLEELIGPNTINTVPDITLNAFRDHGIAANNLCKNIANAPLILEEIQQSIDLTELGAQLQQDGLKMFEKSFDDLIELMK